MVETSRALRLRCVSAFTIVFTSVRCERVFTRNSSRMGPFPNEPLGAPGSPWEATERPWEPPGSPWEPLVAPGSPWKPRVAPSCTELHRTAPNCTELRRVRLGKGPACANYFPAFTTSRMLNASLSQPKVVSFRSCVAMARSLRLPSGTARLGLDAPLVRSRGAVRLVQLPHAHAVHDRHLGSGGCP
jgi:hypothetical protein